MPDTHPNRQEQIKRTESKGSQNSSYTPVLLNGFLGVHWRLLNLYKHRADNRSNICSSKAAMTQHSQAADSNLFPETIHGETWPCMSPWLQMPLGISKEENIPELPSSPPLLPSSLSVLSAILFLRLSPHPPQQTAQSSSALTHHLFLLSSILHALPTGQTGNSDLTFRRQGMTLGSMCAATIRTNRTYRHLLPGTGRRLPSELGLSTNTDALLPGIHPNRT